MAGLQQSGANFIHKSLSLTYLVSDVTPLDSWVLELSQTIQTH